MKGNRLMMMMAGLGTIGAVAMAKALEADAADRRYDLDADKRKAEDLAAKRATYSNSKPVPGGGARERARRLARMQATEPECRCDTFNQFLCPNHE